MIRRRVMRFAALAFLLCVGSAAPVEWSDGRIIAQAACADGTCCPEERSLCITGNVVIFDYYLKAGGGPCGVDPTRPVPPP
jgi:hypothetical protein